MVVLQPRCLHACLHGTPDRRLLCPAVLKDCAWQQQQQRTPVATRSALTPLTPPPAASSGCVSVCGLSALSESAAACGRCLQHACLHGTPARNLCPAALRDCARQRLRASHTHSNQTQSPPLPLRIVMLHANLLSPVRDAAPACRIRIAAPCRAPMRTVCTHGLFATRGITQAACGCLHCINIVYTLRMGKQEGDERSGAGGAEGSAAAVLCAAASARRNLKICL